MTLLVSAGCGDEILDPLYAVEEPEPAGLCPLELTPADGAYTHQVDVKMTAELVDQLADEGLATRSVVHVTVFDAFGTCPSAMSSGDAALVARVRAERGNLSEAAWPLTNEEVLEIDVDVLDDCPPGADCTERITITLVPNAGMAILGVGVRAETHDKLSEDSEIVPGGFQLIRVND